MSRVASSLLFAEIVLVPLVVWGAGWLVYEYGDLYPLISPSLYGNLLFVLTGAVGLLNCLGVSHRTFPRQPSASVNIEPLETRVSDLETDVDALSAKVVGLVAFTEIQKKRESGQKSHKIPSTQAKGGEGHGA